MNQLSANSLIGIRALSFKFYTIKQVHLLTWKYFQIVLYQLIQLMFYSLASHIRFESLD